MPQLISDTILSRAWARALALTVGSTDEVSELVVSIAWDQTTYRTNDPIQTDLDKCLADLGEYETDSVASTIFPISMWNSSKPRARLFERYSKIYPRLKKVPQNRYGIYFGRMIGADGGTNQLDFILGTRERGNHRRSAYQLTIYDPVHDLTDQRQRGFPCLHQVSFVPDGVSQTLRIVAYYATQTLLEKAFGNYLGLARLGMFVAKEWDLVLEQVTCVAAVAKLSATSKGAAAGRGLFAQLGVAP